MSEQMMNSAIERQCTLLAHIIPTEKEQVSLRALAFGRYISLLRDPTIASEPAANELAALATKFYLTPHYEEATVILDAGGPVYGF
jgi:hypothetical protein